MDSSHESGTINLSPEDLLPNTERNHGDQRRPGDIQKLSNCDNERESKKDRGRRWSMHGQKGQPEIAITVRLAGNRRAECRPDQFSNGGDKKIVMEGGNPEQYWMVGTLMTKKEHESLVRFFNHNSDIFAWTPHEMPGVDPEVISHRLGVDPKVKPVM